ncbi:MAG: hypothetical protein PHU04_04310 [Candidatus Peribacteraceae bacterium]|nr:hypothetical protein [Candidatus Peribacteraceae bacterium]
MHPLETPENVQAAIAAGDVHRLSPAMQAAVDENGWEIARTLGCLGDTESDVTDHDGAGDLPDLVKDFEGK